MYNKDTSFNQTKLLFQTDKYMTAQKLFFFNAALRFSELQWEPIKKDTSFNPPYCLWTQSDGDVLYTQENAKVCGP